MLRHSLILGCAFAAADKGSGSSGKANTPETPAPAPNVPDAPPAAPAAPEAPATTTEAATKTPRVAPVFAEIRTGIPVPKREKTRGSKPVYDFDKLEINASFGILNKSAANIASIVSNAIKKAMVQKTDASGKLLFKMKEVKDANGAVVATIPTDEPEMVKTKKFEAFDVDPATDPDKATVRIFRTE